jgi:pre-mRNA-splicing factor 38B
MVIKEEDTFNVHPTLLRSLCSSQYFLKLCQAVYDWNALVDTIYYDVQHVEPWMTQGSGTGAVKVPSQAFCLLLRLLTLRCTEKQMHLMLNHVDSPYIRCIGFLYLRYVADPNTLLSWCKPFLFDEEPVQVVAAHKSQSKNPTDKSSTVGSFVRSILLHMDYYGTLLPRLPIHVEKNIKGTQNEFQDNTFLN